MCDREREEERERENLVGDSHEVVRAGGGADAVDGDLCVRACVRERERERERESKREREIDR